MYSRKSCPKGTISRKSYKKKSGIKVKSTCVKSTSLRSKGIKPKKVIPKLKSGSLTKYGYSVHNTKSIRHKALKKAYKTYGYSLLIKKLNAVRVLSRNTAPKNSKIYADDMKYVEKLSFEMPKKRSSKRRSSKRRSSKRRSMKIHSSKRRSMKRRSSKRRSMKRRSKQKGGAKKCSW